MIKAFRQTLSFLPFLLSLLLFPSFRASAEPVDLLINGSFSAQGGGWSGAEGEDSCANGSPSLAPWGVDSLVFSYEYGVVTQEVVIPTAGDVTLSFFGQLGQAGGYYEASLSDDDETVSTGQLTNVEPTSQELSVTTQSDEETVTVTFAGVDSVWWADCYGPIITNASLYGEPEVVETTTTTTEPPAPVGGLNVIGYQVTNIPPTISDEQYQQCGTAWYPNILQTWDSPNLHVGTCGWDQFMMHYSGTIEIPEHQTIEFRIFSDDGSHVVIGDLEPFGWWVDKGCSPSDSGQVDLPAGVYSIDAWMYENGGGTCFEFYWNIDGAGWVAVPQSAFTGAEPTPPTTTTTTTTTTIPEETTTTTTEPETTTTTEPEVTSPPNTPPDSTPEETTPPETTPEETSPPETTPEETSPPETAPEETVPEDTAPEETSPPETAPEETTPPETIPEQPEETTPPVEETPIEELLAVEDPAALEALLDEINLEEASDDDLIAIIGSDAFGKIDSDKIKAVIESLDIENLSDEQTAQLVEALNTADDSVKETFEEEVNVYSGQFDTYVPSGSAITVGQRRVVVAVTAVTSISGATTGVGAGRRKK